MPEPQIVRPGQIWADNDPRRKGRLVRVKSVDSRYAYVVVVDVQGRPYPSDERARHSRVLLIRMRPTSTGYRLVRDVDDTYVCCDLHNAHCEPPGDLCCYSCTEVAHGESGHGGAACVLHTVEEADRG